MSADRGCGPENGNKKRPRTGPLALILLSGFLLIVSFQNFSGIPLEKLKPELPQARALRLTTQDSTDIREWAPEKPTGTDEPSLASPTSGDDLDSISRDWLSKQSQLMTGGAEQRLIASVNKRLERWMKFEPVQGEPWPEPGDDSSSSDDSSESGEGTASPQAPQDPNDIFSSLTPTSIRLLSANKIEVNFASRTHLSCMVNGGQLELDLNQPITGNFGVDLRHRSGAQANSVHLNYSW